ncbi:hypothetical protein BY996DRAFT_6646798 [Phakopsora pachyrhizi]|nr:hypothetical protein BY996DRAFT_6646798 [Phakopsora pachyrhizi]
MVKENLYFSSVTKDENFDWKEKDRKGKDVQFIDKATGKFEVEKLREEKIYRIARVKQYRCEPDLIIGSVKRPVWNCETFYRSFKLLGVLFFIILFIYLFIFYKVFYIRNQPELRKVFFRIADRPIFFSFFFFFSLAKFIQFIRIYKYT